MMRRRRVTPSAEGGVGFADVAMSILGPTAFLMLVFMVFAALNANQGCRALPESDIAEKAKNLKTWFAGQVAENSSLENEWKTACPGQPPPSRLPPGDTRLVPTVLADVCIPYRDAILKKANVDPAQFNAMIAQRAALTQALIACTRDKASPCVQLTEASDREKRVKALRAWRDARQKELTETEHTLTRQCPNAKVDDRALGFLAPLPQPLADLCAADRAQVLSEAKIETGALNATEQKLAAVLRAWRACSPGPLDVGCKTARQISKIERETLTAELGAWEEGLREGVRRDEELMEKKRCEFSKGSYGTVPKLDIEPLKKHAICPGAEASVLAEANITDSALAALAASRHRLDTALRACVGQMDASCVALSNTEVQARAQELGAWREDLSQRVSDDEKLASRYCEQPSSGHRGSPALVLLPSSLDKAKGCQNEFPTVLSGRKTCAACSKRGIGWRLGRTPAF